MPESTPDKIQVSIAGMGVICAVGCGVEVLHAALQKNASGLRPSGKFSSPRFQSNIVGAIPADWWGERPREPLAKKSDHLPTAAREDAHPAGADNPAWILAHEALQQARDSAQKILADISAQRIGLVLSTTKANITALEFILENRPCSEKARRHLQPDLLAADLAEKFGARGPVQTVSVACVSGLVAISQGVKLIQRGEVDAVFVIGVDCLSEFVVAGFTALKAIDPLGCRPFDAARCGLSPGEAGAALVLVGGTDLRPVVSGVAPETVRDVDKPGFGSNFSDVPLRTKSGGTPDLTGETPVLPIKIRAFGSSNDANHLTGPSRDGSGLAQAIRAALDAAKLSSLEIDYVHTHGTGTGYNDAMESLALKTIFGTAGPPVSGSKGMLGHTLGAAGVLETIICVLAMQRNFLPGTPRLNVAAEGAPPGLVREPRAAKLKNVLKLNTGFGGMNGALILSQS